jgi:hypothetical protein
MIVDVWDAITVISLAFLTIDLSMRGGAVSPAVLITARVAAA